MRHDAAVRAALKGVWLHPEPSELSADPSEFSLLARMMVGPADGPGEESFDVTVCTPQWLARQAQHGFFDARHHVLVDFETFDTSALRRWLAKRVESVQGDTWREVAERVGRLGGWEFEQYRP